VTQHGGNETTLFSIIANLLHFGMVIVGLPYSHAGQMTHEESLAARPIRRQRSQEAKASVSRASSNSTARGTKAH
jgi:multimeric flavodoxin WrbA